MEQGVSENGKRHLPVFFLGYLFILATISLASKGRKGEEERKDSHGPSPDSRSSLLYTLKALWCDNMVATSHIRLLIHLRLVTYIGKDSV